MQVTYHLDMLSQQQLNAEFYHKDDSFVLPELWLLIYFLLQYFLLRLHV